MTYVAAFSFFVARLLAFGTLAGPSNKPVLRRLAVGGFVSYGGTGAAQLDRIAAKNL
jgi:hypothetical protein